MESLLLSNLLYRKTRTVLSVLGIALGVTLVALTTGLVRGFESSQAARNSAITAEIMLRPPGGQFTLGSSLSNIPVMPVDNVQQLQSIEGVEEIVPISQVMLGPHLIDGVDYDQFTKVSNARIIEGRPPVSDDELIIDGVLQQRRGWSAGEWIPILGGVRQIVGVYGPESLARFKVTLSSMQRFTNRPGSCTMALIRIKPGSSIEAVAARIKRALPDHNLILTRNLPALYARGTPALQTFLNVTVGLAATISFLIMLLSMHTTIMERTKQIGILKSLGASNYWIAAEVEKEAIALAMLGVCGGLALSLAGKAVLETATTLTVAFDPFWLTLGVMTALLAGAVGALYPALRAASQDPVKALSYE